MLETHAQMERRDEEEAEHIVYGTSQPKPTVTFIIVAFRYDEKKSVLYDNSKYPSAIANLVVHALQDLKADVISIRRVYEKCPKPT